MRKWYHDYLISYTFTLEGYLTSCNGTSGISRVKKIDTFDEVQAAIDFIKQQVDGAENIAINNIMYLGRNKH